MSHRRNIPCLLVMGLLLLASAGCSDDPTLGYTTQSLYPQDVDTVAVNMFTRGRSVYRRDLEFRLTEAVVKRIELDTPYKVTDKSRADTLLTGQIDEITQQVLSRNPDSGLPREKEILFRLSFTWTDLRSGDVLVEHSNFRVSGTYISQDPFSEDFFQGSEDVINRAAKRLVETLESEW